MTRRRPALFPLSATLLVGCAGQAEVEADQPEPAAREASVELGSNRGGVEAPGPTEPDPLVDLGPRPEGPLEVIRIAATPSPDPSPDEQARRPFEGVEEIWRARIGKTTYRSTIHVTGDWVVVNSNGEDLKSSDDRLDVVWILRAETGEEVRRIKPPGRGEKDCNGIALADDHLVFGTDQGVVYSYDWFGRLLWSRRLDGDVEAAPALVDLDLDGYLDVAVGSEAGTFYALEGKAGRELWRHRAGKGDYDQTGFVAVPAIHDVDRNGTPDVLVPSRDQVFRALNGATGKELWRFRGGSGMHGSPVLIDPDGDGSPDVVFSEAYRRVYMADAATGRVRWSSEVDYGLMGPIGYYPEAGCVVVGTAWGRGTERISCLDQSSGAERWRWTQQGANITSGFVVGDVDGSPGAELVFGTEAGTLVALDPEGHEVFVENVGGPIECTPTLADVDEDGKLDVLVAANDGYLRVYRTSGFPPAAIGYFRGDRGNGGRLP